MQKKEKNYCSSELKDTLEEDAGVARGNARARRGRHWSWKVVVDCNSFMLPLFVD